MTDVPQPVIDPETVERLRSEASARGISIDKLLAERLGADAQAPVGVPLRFACPIKGCTYRAGTLAAVCSEHGIHVV